QPPFPTVMPCPETSPTAATKKGCLRPSGRSTTSAVPPKLTYLGPLEPPISGRTGTAYTAPVGTFSLRLRRELLPARVRKALAVYGTFSLCGRCGHTRSVIVSSTGAQFLSAGAWNRL